MPEGALLHAPLEVHRTRRGDPSSTSSELDVLFAKVDLDAVAARLAQQEQDVGAAPGCPWQVRCHKCLETVCVEGRSARRPRGSVGRLCPTPSCRNHFCVDCGYMWSNLHDCQLAANLRGEREKRLASLEFEEFSAALLPDVTLKRCPACGTACEKSDEDDCDHITCLCQHEFCWKCGADRTVILHHGNHYHKVGCPYNFDPDFFERKYMPRCPLCVDSGVACKPPPPMNAAECAADPGALQALAPDWSRGIRAGERAGHGALQGLWPEKVWDPVEDAAAPSPVNSGSVFDCQRICRAPQRRTLQPL